MAPPGPGVMVMQLSVPNGPQPSQNPPLVQWNPCKYYSIEQRASKPGDLYKPDNTPQVNKSMMLFIISIAYYCCLSSVLYWCYNKALLF